MSDRVASTDEMPRPPRATTITYLLALLMIATIAVASHILSSRMVQRQERTAAVVNIAGRQRMLSQRITRIAEESASGLRPHAAASAELATLVDRMSRAQQQLVHGDTTLGLPAADSPQLREIYFGRTHLEQQVLSFLDNARTFAAEPAPTLGDVNLSQMIGAANAPLLSSLDAAVSEYQRASEHDVRHLRHLMNSLTGLMMIVLVLEALLIYRPLFNRLTGAISLLIRVSATDALTGALNRRAFLAAADRELSRSFHAGATVCLLMCDLDKFKAINDTYGHPAGDLMLQKFASVAEESIRPGDSLGRLGGEEFAVLLPGASLQQGEIIAERLRERFANAFAEPSRGQRVCTTVSLGLVAARKGTLNQLIAVADQLLYQAKSGGRNRVVAQPFEVDPAKDTVPGQPAMPGTPA